MGGQSLLVMFVVLAATGTVPVAVWLLTTKYRPARCRADAGNAGLPVRTPAAENCRSRERGREPSRERARNVSGQSGPQEAGRLGGAAQIERNLQGRRRNTLADRGRGYVL